MSDCLERCIQSVINQSYVDFELIIIDDGSGDGTSSIIEGYAKEDHRIIFLRNERRRGVSFSRNKGLKEAKGEYVAFIDGDDYYDKDYLMKMVRIAETNNADIAICNWINVTPDGSMIRGRQRAVGSISEKDLYEGMFKTDTIPGYLWIKLFRRSAIEGALFDEDVYIWEDVLFSIKSYKSARTVIATDEPLYYYVNTGKSATISNDYKKRIRVLSHALMTTKKIWSKDIPEKYYRLKRMSMFGTLVDLVFAVKKDAFRCMEKKRIKSYRNLIRKCAFDFFFFSRVPTKEKAKLFIKMLYAMV